MPFDDFRFDSCQRLSSKGWRAFLLMNLVGLAACGTAPPYERPALDVPAAFKEGVPGSGVWQAAQPQDAVPDDWWRLFNDPVLDQLQQQAQQANQNIALALARLRAAHAALDGSRAALAPTLGANAGSTRARSNGSAGPSIATADSIGLAAGWELDLWGRLSAGAEAAQASLQASADDLAAMRLSVQASVAQTYFALRAAEAQERLLGETLAAYQRSWDLTQNRYRAGVASSADVAQAQATYLSTQAQRIEAQTSRAQLEHALAARAGQAPAAVSLVPTAALPAPQGDSPCRLTTPVLIAASA